MVNPHLGRHEFGQNFLVNTAVIDHIVGLVAERPGPIVEWGTGNGAIALGLNRLGRRLEGIEIDPRRVEELRRKVGPRVFSSRGRGIVEILRRNGVPRRIADLVRRERTRPAALARDLRAEDWADAYRAGRHEPSR